MSIFKRSTAGLNSEVPFSETGCLTKAKDPTLPYYFLIACFKYISSSIPIKYECF